MPLFCAEISEAAVHPMLIVLLHQPAERAFTGGASLPAAATAA